MDKRGGGRVTPTPHVCHVRRGPEGPAVRTGPDRKRSGQGM